jgi:phospholipase C
MATKQAYFAVAVNDDGTMYIDNDISINYDESPIWNEATELWEDISEHEGFYDEAHYQLQRLINGHNESPTKNPLDK